MAFVKDFVGKIRRRLATKRWAFSLGGTALGFLLITLFALANFLNLTNNPSYNLPESFRTLRLRVIQEGKIDRSFHEDNFSFRSAESRTISREAGENVYVVSAFNDPRLADWLGFWQDSSTANYRYCFGLIYDYSIAADSIRGSGYSYYGTFNLAAKESDGSATTLSETMECNFLFNEDGAYQILHPLQNTPPSEIDEEAKAIIEAFDDNLANFAANLPTMMAALGFPAYRQMTPTLYALLDSTGGLIPATFFIALLAGLLFILFGTAGFIALLQLLAKKRASSLLEEEATSRDQIAEAILEEEPADILTLEDLPGGLDTAIARRAKAIKVKPVLHENFIRIFGLALLFIAGLFTGITALLSASNIGITGMGIILDMKPYFTAITSLGNVILVLVIVTIVAETRRFLLRNSLIFFTLGLAYYVAVSFFMLFVEQVFVSPLLSFFALVAFQVALPGNIFMALGGYYFIGFFLFTQPNPRLINRKVFRWLCLIPTLLALAAIVFNGMLHFSSGLPPYWITNFLYLRDPSMYLLGIGYEFIIFGLRSRYQRKLGLQSGRQVESIPEIQMVKNFALCGLIVAFTIAFYCIPYDIRVDLGFPSRYSFALLAVPLFLFQKPSGQNRKFYWDLVYYVLFLICYFTPSILEAIGKIFAR